ncbi:hypothetical protein HK102_007202, partial [Quaeritorhiza haematococci]
MLRRRDGLILFAIGLLLSPHLPTILPILATLGFLCVSVLIAQGVYYTRVKSRQSQKYGPWFHDSVQEPQGRKVGGIIDEQEYLSSISLTTGEPEKEAFETFSEVSARGRRRSSLYRFRSPFAPKISNAVTLPTAKRGGRGVPSGVGTQKGVESSKLETKIAGLLNEAVRRKFTKPFFDGLVYGIVGGQQGFAGSDIGKANDTKNGQNNKNDQDKTWVGSKPSNQNSDPSPSSSTNPTRTRLRSVEQSFTHTHISNNLTRVASVLTLWIRDQQQYQQGGRRRVGQGQVQRVDQKLYFVGLKVLRKFVGMYKRVAGKVHEKSVASRDQEGFFGLDGFGGDGRVSGAGDGPDTPYRHLDDFDDYFDESAASSSSASLGAPPPISTITTPLLSASLTAANSFVSATITPIPSLSIDGVPFSISNSPAAPPIPNSNSTTTTTATTINAAFTAIDDLNARIVKRMRKENLIHPALRTGRKEDEIHYIRSVVSKIWDHLLLTRSDSTATSTPLLKTLIREYITCQVILPIINTLSDPHFINTQIAREGGRRLVLKNTIRGFRGVLGGVLSELSWGSVLGFGAATMGGGGGPSSFDGGEGDESGGIPGGGMSAGTASAGGNNVGGAGSNG